MFGDDEDEGETHPHLSQPLHQWSARERTETSVRDEWKLHFGLQSSRLKVATAAKCFSA